MPAPRLHDSDPVRMIRPSDGLAGMTFQIGHRLFIISENLGENKESPAQIVWRIIPAIGTVANPGTIIWPDNERIEVFA